MQPEHISEHDFALGLIDFVKQSLYAIKDTEAGCVPDCWTHNSEDRELSESVKTYGMHPFDAIFLRVPLIPEAWRKFQRQFFSPLMDLFCRLEQESEMSCVHAWNGQTPWRRQDFHMKKDFWTNETQESNYQHLLNTLGQRGLLRGRSTTRYKDDPDAVTIQLCKTAFGQETLVDIPGTYRALKRALDKIFIAGISAKDAQSIDVPSVAEPYGSHKPILYLVATTARDAEEPAPHPSMQQIGQAIHNRIKYQNIIYVLADRNRGIHPSQITPRYIGVMQAYALELDKGSPTGAILCDYPRNLYFVPQLDLSPNEKRSLEASQFNWRSHQGSFLTKHPELSEAIRARIQK